MIDTEDWGQRIEKALEENDGPEINVILSRGAAEELVKLMKQEETAEDFEQAYMMGYGHGYQMAVKEVIKKLRGMKWYGGNKQEKCAD